MGDVKFIKLITENENDLLTTWVKQQTSSKTFRSDLISEKALREETMEFLKLLITSLREGKHTDITSAEWNEMRQYLKRLSAGRAEKGFTPSETVHFVFGFKEILFTMLSEKLAKIPADVLNEIQLVDDLIDKLGLFTMEEYINVRQEVIKRQQQELLEISTPIVKIWEGVLALPLIGTLDSARTQVVMETLLEQIVATGSQVAIIDITGIPAVDTLVAQHLMKTVAAARLMGAECIISGIRPHIAQTMVHLGVGFADVVTKATLAEAIRYAFKLLNFTVVKEKKTTKSE